MCVFLPFAFFFDSFSTQSRLNFILCHPIVNFSLFSYCKRLTFYCYTLSFFSLRFLVFFIPSFLSVCSSTDAIFPSLFSTLHLPLFLSSLSLPSSLLPPLSLSLCIHLFHISFEFTRILSIFQILPFFFFTTFIFIFIPSFRLYFSICFSFLHFFLFLFSIFLFSSIPTHLIHTCL